jgi:hypothetical protein
MVERALIATMRRPEIHTDHPRHPNGVTVLERPDRRQAVFLQALDAATTKFKPTPFKRPEVEELSGEETDDILDTVTDLDLDYSRRLAGLTNKQSAVFTHAYRQGLIEQSSHKQHTVQHPTTDNSQVHVHHDRHDHDHQHHAHAHEEPKSKPVISRGWQVATVAGNALIGAAELAVGGGSTLSVTTDGIHNAGDAGTYYLQTENVLNPKLNEQKIKRRRRIAHAIIAGLSVSAAAKAGYDLQFGEDGEQNPATIYAAGASLALNSLLMATLYRGINRKKREGMLGPHEKDLTKHLWAIDVPSAAIAVGGAVAQKYGINDIESVGAVASGLLGAYAFRPTANNLEHNHCAKHGDHAGHDHGHGHEDRHESQPQVQSRRHAPGEGKVSVAEISERLKRETEGREASVIPFAPPRKRRRIAQTAAAVSVVAALGAGATGAARLQDHSEMTDVSAHASIVLQAPQPQPENRIPFDLPTQPERIMTSVSEPTTVFETVQQGDTQWGMVEESVEQSGRTADTKLVNVLTDLAAHENQDVAANPDNLSIGQELAMPSQQVIKLVDETLDNPSSDPTLAKDLQELNSADDMPKEEKIEKKEKLISKIKNYIKTKFQKVKTFLMR